MKILKVSNKWFLNKKITKANKMQKKKNKRYYSILNKIQMKVQQQNISYNRNKKKKKLKNPNNLKNKIKILEENQLQQFL